VDQTAGAVAVAQVDWSRPWFAPWRAKGQPVADRVGDGMPLHEALDVEHHAPVRFVPHEALPVGQPYEAYVAASGTCPVRPGLHDFFNGICWLGLPLSKSVLNRLQAAELDARGAGGARGPVRDAITLFDENGALLDAPPVLWAALLERDWRRLFGDLRPLWSQARLLVVGHALLEKLVAPRKELTAHVLRLPVDCASLEAADAALSARLSATMLGDKPFTPLPLLGIPGWCPENEQLCFYDDARVFRHQPPGSDGHRPHRFRSP
jgi:hypothetical protein